MVIFGSPAGRSTPASRDPEPSAQDAQQYGVRQPDFQPVHAAVMTSHSAIRGQRLLTAVAADFRIGAELAAHSRSLRSAEQPAEMVFVQVQAAYARGLAGRHARQRKNRRCYAAAPQPALHCMGRISPESWQRSGQDSRPERAQRIRTGQAAAKPGGSAARFRLETRAAKLPLLAVAGSEQPGPGRLGRSPPLHPARLAQVEGLRRRRVAEEGVASGTPVAGDPGRQDPGATFRLVIDDTGQALPAPRRQDRATRFSSLSASATRTSTPPWRGSNDSS